MGYSKEELKKVRKDLYGLVFKYDLTPREKDVITIGCESITTLINLSVKINRTAAMPNEAETNKQQTKKCVRNI